MSQGAVNQIHPAPSQVIAVSALTAGSLTSLKNEDIPCLSLQLVS